jgi:hypothetical protein
MAKKAIYTEGVLFLIFKNKNKFNFAKKIKR